MSSFCDDLLTDRNSISQRSVTFTLWLQRSPGHTSTRLIANAFIRHFLQFVTNWILAPTEIYFKNLQRTLDPVSFISDRQRFYKVWIVLKIPDSLKGLLIHIFNMCYAQLSGLGWRGEGVAGGRAGGGCCWGEEKERKGGLSYCSDVLASTPLQNCASVSQILTPKYHCVS